VPAAEVVLPGAGAEASHLAAVAMV